MKVNDSLKNKSKRWKGLLKHNADEVDCLHCKYTRAEQSVPTKDFKAWDKKSGTVKTVTEITIKYGRHDDVIGWTF